MRWFFDLEGAGQYNWAANRVLITSQEDVGLAGMDTAVYVAITMELATKWHKGNNEAWRIAVGNVIRALARAKKSREGDHFQAAVQERMKVGDVEEMPDYAIDNHTSKGKRMGRGVDFFLKEGARLQPPAGPDEYEVEARRFWEREESGDLFAEA